jgi:hypothetical protein
VRLGGTNIIQVSIAQLQPLYHCGTAWRVLSAVSQVYYWITRVISKTLHYDYDDDDTRRPPRVQSTRSQSYWSSSMWLDCRPGTVNRIADEVYVCMCVCCMSTRRNAEHVACVGPDWCRVGWMVLRCRDILRRECKSVRRGMNGVLTDTWDHRHDMNVYCDKSRWIFQEVSYLVIAVIGALF